MTEQEAMERIKSILYEATADKNAVCYVTDYDEDALKIAIKSLEKQIPKEPIPQDEDCLECPNCDSFIGYASECKDEYYRVEYCPNCGQAIDWGNEE